MFRSTIVAILLYGLDFSAQMHSVVSASFLKDRILYQGRRRGMQFSYWIEAPSELEPHRP